MLVISSGAMMKQPMVVEESDSEESVSGIESEEGRMSSTSACHSLPGNGLAAVKKGKKVKSDNEAGENQSKGQLNKREQDHIKIETDLPNVMEIEEGRITSGKEEVKDEEDEEKEEEEEDEEDDENEEEDKDSEEEDDENEEEDEDSEEEEGDEIDDYGSYESENIDNDETNKGNVNSGLANVMAKILGTKKSENVILSKAKKDWEVKEEGSDEEDFKVVDSSGQVKELPKMKVEVDHGEEHAKHERAKMRKLWEKQFRVKPDIEKDHENERQLKIIATQGVVQLFSAIEKHTNMIQKTMSETKSIVGREKVMETIGKDAFLKMLREQGKKFKKEDEENEVKSEVKDEVKDELIDIPVSKKPKWHVFADNFYKEPTLQGWDQESDDD